MAVFRSDVINWRKISIRLFPFGGDSASDGLGQIADRYLRTVPLVAVLGLLASVLESFGVGLLIPLVALLMASGMPQEVPEPIRDIFGLTDGYPTQTRIVFIGATLLGLIAVKGLAQAANGTLIEWVNGRIRRDIENLLASRVLNARYRLFLEQESTRFVQIIDDNSWFTAMAARSALAIIPAAIAMTVFALVLAWLDWRLFALALAAGSLIRGLLYIAERHLRRLGDEVTRVNAALARRIMGTVFSIRVIRIFGQQAREQARFEQSTERARQAHFAVRRLSACIMPGVDTLTSLLFVLILLASWWLGVSVPAITAFLVLLARALPYARTISESRLQVASVRGSIERVEWLLAQASERAERTGLLAPPAEAPIRFEKVSYTYPDGDHAIHAARFEIRTGVTTALIGHSGSGKSTLVNLLCGLIEPDAGAITVGGIPLTQIDIEAWRGRLAIAGQDIELIEGTIAENIAYGRPDASLRQIEDAARMAGAGAFVSTLPQGFATQVGMEGTRLSGGQRQRIGIARALLREPDLLILDEATNSVDAMSEQETMRLLSEHRHFGTAVIISHRKSTLAACQNGVVIEQGRIVESGPLDTLHYYKEMH